jgi:hypothetical protein
LLLSSTEPGFDVIAFLVGVDDFESLLPGVLNNFEGIEKADFEVDFDDEVDLELLDEEADWQLGG